MRKNEKIIKGSEKNPKNNAEQNKAAKILYGITAICALLAYIFSVINGKPNLIWFMIFVIYGITLPATLKNKQK
ncbi:MAG: hypothetical protein Q4A21_02025 [bacterium]|nr:hypothetical protein [bacterium]